MNQYLNHLIGALLISIESILLQMKAKSILTMTWKKSFSEIIWLVDGKLD